MKKILRSTTLCAISLSLMLATPAAAGTFPGANGKVAFTSNRDGNNDIHLMDIDGANPVNITNHPADDRKPAWSADGKKIAFQSDRNGGSYDIYVMNADGTQQTRLTTHSLNDHSPSWSPDGTKIAFVRNLPLPDGSDIFVMNADGSQQTNITQSPGHDFDPSWSPDGTKILFSTPSQENTGSIAVYTMSPNGQNKTAVLEGGSDSSQASWSPTGDRIVFMASFERPFEILIALTNGSIQRHLTYDFNIDQVSPSGAWTPDGTRVVYSSILDCIFELCNRPGDHSSEIYITDVNGRFPVKLTNHDSYDADPVVQPIPVVVPIQITTTTLPAATQRAAYNQTIQTSGGQGPKTFKVLSGELPKGLTLDAATGVLSGEPKKKGIYNFTVEVSDATGVDSQALSLEVKKPPTPPGSTNVNLNLDVSGNDNEVNTLLNFFSH